MRPTAFLSSDIHPGRVSSWRPGVGDVLAEPVSGMKHFILRELIDGPRSIYQLVERIYDDGESEPADPIRCVHVAICLLNKKLQPGWRIISEPHPNSIKARGPQRRYVLRRA